MQKSDKIQFKIWALRLQITTSFCPEPLNTHTKLRSLADFDFWVSQMGGGRKKVILWPFYKLFYSYIQLGKQIINSSALRVLVGAWPVVLQPAWGAWKSFILHHQLEASCPMWDSLAGCPGFPLLCCVFEYFPSPLLGKQPLEWHWLLAWALLAVLKSDVGI